MSGTARAAAIGVGLVMVAASGCALPPWIGHRPVFPATGATAWTIPLYEPLTGYGPKVRAVVCGAAPAAGRRPCAETLLYVDTGASHSALPAATFARLGVELSASHFATIEDAAGDTHAWAGGLVPEVRLDGGMSLAEVVTVVYEETAILGADVLTTRGWRIDLDRGTLRLGPEAVPAAAPAARLPIRGYPERTIVELTVEGRSVPLLLDTGAPITVIDRAWLAALGLPLRSLRFGWPLSARDPNVRLREATDAVLRLGQTDLGRRQVVVYPRGGDRPTRGMLGLDVLSDFTFGVTEGGAFEVVPRPRSPLAGARERVGRWPELPVCPDLPGCIAARLEPGPGVQIRIRVAASSPRDWRYLFACADAAGRLDDRPFWLEIGMRAPAVGQEKVVEVLMPERIRALWKIGCDNLVLLDVNPVVADVRPMTAPVEARMTFSNRRVRLD
jgi:predicted aspartyl protease